MKESNDIGKIGLVIAYKKHISFRQIGKMFSTWDTQFIDDGKSGIRKKSNEKIYNFSDGMEIFQPVNDRGAHKSNHSNPSQIKKRRLWIGKLLAVKYKKASPEGGQYQL